jgi:NTP pyrophosphatase (non-canonical NTP hydrolase)
MDKKELYQKALKKYGVCSQVQMLAEESTELALAVLKFMRKKNQKTMNNIFEEIADVEIMIEQICQILPSYYEVLVPQYKKMKLERLERILNEENQKEESRKE